MTLLTLWRAWRAKEVKAYEHQPPVWITEGLKGFPLCRECQCYPECRMDCPDHRECLRRMPEYLGRFPPGYLDEPPRKSPPDSAAEK